ncbi:hypothetical protein FQZ97_1117590 [compost metagenome]
MAMSASRRDNEKERGTGTSWMVRSGYCCVSRASLGARNVTPKPSGAPIRTVPDTAISALPTCERAESISASMRSAASRNSSPACVSVEPLVRRVSSVVESAVSSAVSLRATVVWLRPSLLAAPRICPERVTARNMRISSQFIVFFV